MNKQCLNRNAVMVILAFSVFLSFCSKVRAGESAIPYRVQSLSVSSGYFTGNGSSYYQAFSTRVTITNAPWLVLHFNNTNLGNESFVQLINNGGGTQILDAISIASWQNYSAFFNGDHVDLNLYVAPTDANVHVEIDQGFVDNHPL